MLTIYRLFLWLRLCHIIGRNIGKARARKRAY